MITPQVRELAKVIWDYHTLSSSLSHSDVILGLGSHDVRVAEHAAALWHDGWAPLIVFSGGRGKVTDSWCDTEATVFARAAMARGVPADAIRLEETATNTGENLTRTRELLDREQVRVTSGILVHKPYMARRTLATAQRQWPGVDWRVSTPPVAFEDYPSAASPEEQLIELMVGDLQRIRVYADQGFQAPMPIPDRVWRAYEQLRRLGFDRYVIPN